MADWEIWLIILVLGVATACTRSAFWLIGHKVTIPPRVDRKSTRLNSSHT